MVLNNITQKPGGNIQGDSDIKIGGTESFPIFPPYTI